MRRRWRRASAAVDSRESGNVSIFPDNFFGEAGVVGFSDKQCSFEKFELGCLVFFGRHFRVLVFLKNKNKKI